MFGNVVNKFLVKRRSKLDQGTEYKLAQDFCDEAAYRNYKAFIDFYTNWFETNRSESDLPSHIQAQNLFSSYKKSGLLDAFNRPVKEMKCKLI